MEKISKLKIIAVTFLTIEILQIVGSSILTSIYSKLAQAIGFLGILIIPTIISLVSLGILIGSWKNPLVTKSTRIIFLICICLGFVELFLTFVSLL
jgi:hypothetical protein